MNADLEVPAPVRRSRPRRRYDPDRPAAYREWRRIRRQRQVPLPPVALPEGPRLCRDPVSGRVKRRYPDAWTALVQLTLIQCRRARAGQPHQEQRSYYHTVCDGWHLTSSRHPRSRTQ